MTALLYTVAALRVAPLGITSETNMWRAWIGFNLSHGFGAMGFGLLYVYLGTFHSDFLLGATPLLRAAPVIASLYVVMALRYWFSIPAIGTGMGAFCFWVGLIGQ